MQTSSSRRAAPSQEIYFSDVYFFLDIFYLVMVSRGDCPASDTGLPRPGAVVRVV